MTATIAELVSSGAGVLAVTADASRRAALANGASGLARFNGGAALIACHRCRADAVASLATRASSGLALVDYAALAIAPDLAAHFEHVVLVDAPRSAADLDRATASFEAPSSDRAEAPFDSSSPSADPAAPPPGTAARFAPRPSSASESVRSEAGAGYLHPLFSDAEHAFALGVLDLSAPSRATIGGVFKALRAGGKLSGTELRSALSGPGPHPLGPETAARALRVLLELNLVAGSTSAGSGVVRVVSSEGTDLGRSPAFRSYSEEHSEARSFLQSQKSP